MPRSKHVEAVAWAPHSRRLALFDNYGGPMRVWNGRRLSRSRDWVRAVGDSIDANVWQVGWSPDESSILLRFYGDSSVRDPTWTGHAVLLNPASGRPRFRWGDEAGPAAWLDSERLIYQASDEFGRTADLVVARPRSSSGRARTLWKCGVLAWELSRDRKTVWALDGNGDLLRSPVGAPRWVVAHRGVVRLGPSGAFHGYFTTTLSFSPRGDIIAVTYGGRSLSLVSASLARPWLATVFAPRGTISLLGWAHGQSLPLLEWRAAESKPSVVVQIQRR